MIPVEAMVTSGATVCRASTRLHHSAQIGLQSHI